MPDNALRYPAIIKNREKKLKHLTKKLFEYLVWTYSENLFLKEVILNDELEESISACYAVLRKKDNAKINIVNTKVKRNLDRNALSCIFENVIVNAVKYSAGDLKIV